MKLTPRDPSASTSAAVTPPSQLPAAVSINPADLIQDVDIVGELIHNRSAYIGKEQATIYDVPKFLIFTLDRIRYSTPFEYDKPGLNPTISCALRYGVDSLHEDDDIRRLVELRETTKTTERAAVHTDLEALDDWFSSVGITIADPGNGTCQKRLNVYLPEGIRQGVSSLANEVGASSSTLMKLAILTAIYDHPAALEGHEQAMRTAMEAFHGRIRLRNRMAELLIEGVGAIDLSRKKRRNRGGVKA